LDQYHSPWLNFEVPNEAISLETIDRADAASYGKELLLYRLREHADYYGYLPAINKERFTSDELSIIANNPNNVSNPDTYMRIGSPCKSSLLLRGLQTANVDLLKPDELPTIRFSLDRFKGNNSILSLIQDSSNNLQMAYWMMQTQLFDTSDKKVSQSFDALFKQENALNRSIMDENIEPVDSYDVKAIDQLRKQMMLQSEDAFANYIAKDRLGFFGGLGGISKPSLTNALSVKAFATDNRRQFSHTNTAEYIRAIGTKDYINYRFEVVNINHDDYLEVQWCFPQADRLAVTNAGESWTQADLIKLYAKV
jgi:uncharacterized protein YdcH (DUF465 family)